MRKVRVVSRKYNGALRDEYETYLYAETDETVTLFSEPGLGYWDHRKAAWSEAQDGLIEIYFRHKWYNVWHICEQVSNTNLIYVNIAMPATLQASGIEWIDLDLDYRVHLDNSVELLDKAEFQQNRQLMGYSPDLVEQVRVACLEVEAGLGSQTYPFDHGRQVELYRRIKAELRGAFCGNVA